MCVCDVCVVGTTNVGRSAFLACSRFVRAKSVSIHIRPQAAGSSSARPHPVLNPSSLGSPFKKTKNCDTDAPMPPLPGFCAVLFPFFRCFR